MTARATDTGVRGIIETGPNISTSPFIVTANRLVNWLTETCDTASVLSADLLAEIETWLAAHFYAHRDPQYIEKKTADASAAFQGKTAMYLDSTFWGQTAQMLDVTGCLKSINKGGRVGLVWLGKPPSDQINYADRD